MLNDLNKCEGLKIDVQKRRFHDLLLNCFILNKANACLMMVSKSIILSLQRQTTFKKSVNKVTIRITLNDELPFISQPSHKNEYLA